MIWLQIQCVINQIYDQCDPGYKYSLVANAVCYKSYMIIVILVINVIWVQMLCVINQI